MILLMTNKEDVHPNPVLRILAERGMPVFRLNTEALLTDYEFEWHGGNSDCTFTIVCRANGLVLKSGDITAVWDRRPEPPNELPFSSSPDVDRHNREEAREFLTFLHYGISDIPSIGSITRDRVAASKILQMQVAREVGFSVPETLFTNRKAIVVNFAEKFKELALKPISSSGIWNEEEGTERVFYSQKIPAAAINEVPEEAFTQTVSFIQEYIPKDYELRVTVVGERVFPCRIDSQEQQEDQGKTDWRQGYDHGIRFVTCEIPEIVACRCRQFLHRMGLRFGAFDLILTPAGEYVFLECNPNGQWLWVELATGMPISTAIADELSQYESIKS